MKKNTSNFFNTRKRKGGLPKGINPIILQEVTNLLEYKQVKGITAVDLSEQSAQVGRPPEDIWNIWFL